MTPAELRKLANDALADARCFGSSFDHDRATLAITREPALARAVLWLLPVVEAAVAYANSHPGACYSVVERSLYAAVDAYRAEVKREG